MFAVDSCIATVSVKTAGNNQKSEFGFHTLRNMVLSGFSDDAIVEFRYPCENT